MAPVASMAPLNTGNGTVKQRCPARETGRRESMLTRLCPLSKTFSLENSLIGRRNYREMPLAAI